MGHRGQERPALINLVVLFLVQLKLVLELQGVTCHMGSYSVTCHLTQVNVPHLNPSQYCKLLLQLPIPEGRKTKPPVYTAFLHRRLMYALSAR